MCQERFHLEVTFTMRLTRWAGALEEGKEGEFQVGVRALQRHGILRPGSLGKGKRLAGKGKLLGIWGASSVGRAGVWLTV